MRLKGRTYKDGALDAITMCSYIEHSYHPYQDVLVASRLLKPGGLLYVSTFHIDSKAFAKLGNKWGMFEWNHVYHFSSKTLKEMIDRAGLVVVEDGMGYNAPEGHLICRKK